MESGEWSLGIRFADDLNSSRSDTITSNSTLQTPLSVQPPHALRFFAEAVLFAQLFAGFGGDGASAEDAEDGGAGAGHNRAERAAVQQAALDLLDSAQASVVHVLKDVVHAAADAVQVAVAQGLHNAGGVGVSALEMSQNAMRLHWTAEEVDAKLKQMMVNIHKESMEAAKEYGLGYDLVAGANIAGFKRVAEAMMEQGLF